jgi:hypothetical protein
MSVLVALILIKDTSTDSVQAVIHSDVLYTVLYYAIFIKGERRLFFDCSFPSERPPGSLLTSRRLAFIFRARALNGSAKNKNRPLSRAGSTI